MRHLVMRATQQATPPIYIYDCIWFCLKMGLLLG